MQTPPLAAAGMARGWAAGAAWSLFAQAASATQQSAAAAQNVLLCSSLIVSSMPAFILGRSATIIIPNHGRRMAIPATASGPTRRRQQGKEALLRGRLHGFAARNRLDADMIGPGVPMLLDAPADRGLVAPGDDRINQAIRPAAGQVGIGEA